MAKKEVTLERATNCLKCCRCELYMISSIYICEEKHRVCDDCMKVTKICVICKMRIFSRDKRMESLATRALYPCRWQELCGVYTAKEIRVHEYNCPSRKYNCPAMCQLTLNYHDMVSHLKKLHPNTNMELVEGTVFTGTQKTNHAVFMMSHNEIFTCDMIIGTVETRWSVRLPGPYSRAMDFSVYLEVGGTQYTMKVHTNEPRFIVDLPNAQLPPDETFEYYIVVLNESSLDD